MLGMMPLSLPVMPMDAKAEAGAQAGALLGMAAGIAKTQGDSVAREAQLLTDLIQPEQLSGEGKFEIPQLPPSNESTSASTLHRCDCRRNISVRSKCGSR
jgi:flagellar hook-length control protein FliK